MGQKPTSRDSRADGEQWSRAQSPVKQFRSSNSLADAVKPWLSDRGSNTGTFTDFKSPPSPADFAGLNPTRTISSSRSETTLPLLRTTHREGQIDPAGTWLGTAAIRRHSANPGRNLKCRSKLCRFPASGIRTRTIRSSVTRSNQLSRSETGKKPKGSNKSSIANHVRLSGQ